MNKHVKILLTLKSLGFAFLFSTGLVAHAAVDNGDVNPASTTAMQQSKKSLVSLQMRRANQLSGRTLL